MTGVSRREFFGMLAASVGAAAGCEGPTGAALAAREPDAGTVVTDVDELEAAFEDLSPGETIYVSDRNAPYRTTRWLDVDADGVTVTGPGVPGLIEPADGANVGGFRVGHNERCRDVRLRGIGYHGNPEGQRDSAGRLHGIAVRNATNVLIAGNRIRGTHPRRHGDGGSGVSVTRRCSDVWVVGNRIHEYGDRGVQLGGRRIVVSGNEVTNGLDRAVACDLWYPSGQNHAAGDVSVFGNLLGDSVEGSLVGIARNTTNPPDDGHVTVFGNLGFGSHKSFCHVRGPEALRNVSVLNNASSQEVAGLETAHTTYAGVAIDVAEGRNFTVRGNALSGYSGHGVHVHGDVRNVTIQQNDLADSDLAGIRLTGVTGGVLGGNVVTRAGAAGVRLDRTSAIDVRDNCIRRPARAGIVSEGATSTTGNDVAGNSIRGAGRTATEPVPAVLVRDAGVRVRGNAIRGHDGPAIREGEDAADNLYEDNWAPGENSWRISAPTSRVRNNAPPVDVHRGVSAGGDGVVRVDFEKPYARRPRLSFGRIGGGLRDVSYGTDGAGNYVAARVTVERDDAVLDVFVADGE